MSTLTILTAPKPFVDPHIATIQRNTLHSWKLLGEEVSVILHGDDRGVAEAADEFGFLHVPDVACNPEGVPYIDDMLARTRSLSDAPLLAIVNTDIILLPDFLATARKVAGLFEEFVLVGRRWDLDINDLFDFSPGWEDRLEHERQSHSVEADATASDYFIFPRQVFPELPEFTIGRAGWDNWMIYHASRQPWTLLDTSSEITAIHQNHDYRHLPGGMAHYQHPDSRRNVALGGGDKRMYDQHDITMMLVDGKVRRKPFSWYRLVHRIERWLWPEEDDGKLRRRMFRVVHQYRKGLKHG